MIEKFPKISYNEGKENAERPPRYRTIEREILEIYDDGSKRERVIECNGIHHRRCVDKVSYNEKGEVIFADQLSRDELGACDDNHQ